MSRPSPPPGYSTREVAGLLDLSEDQVRSHVRSGYLEPQRGSQNELRFSFQDLVILRAAKGLEASRIPTRRVRQSLRNLQRQLPHGRNLAAVRLRAEGKHIVARAGNEAWEPLSGQRVLDFEGAGAARQSRPQALESVADAAAPAAEAPEDAARTAEDWYELGVELESTASHEAQAAYAQAIALAAEHPDAHLNLGRLLHEEKRFAKAERHYRRALASRPADATAAFNLGVVLQDQGRSREAIAAYRQAVDADPSAADAFYNLAGLYQELGEAAAAIRSLKAYRALTGASEDP
ncbi:MAG: tetratricopeptide repeat protein [Acidobacteriota bacterium]